MMEGAYWLYEGLELEYEGSELGAIAASVCTDASLAPMETAAVLLAEIVSRRCFFGDDLLSPLSPWNGGLIGLGPISRIAGVSCEASSASSISSCAIGKADGPKDEDRLLKDPARAKGFN